MGQLVNDFDWRSLVVFLKGWSFFRWWSRIGQ
jgi:hypothetical protein